MKTALQKKIGEELNASWAKRKIQVLRSDEEKQLHSEKKAREKDRRLKARKGSRRRTKKTIQMADRAEVPGMYKVWLWNEELLRMTKQ